MTLLAYTGLRYGELVGLRVEDVDLGSRRIRVGAHSGRRQTARGRSKIRRRSPVHPHTREGNADPLGENHQTTPRTTGDHVSQWIPVGAGELETLHAVARSDRRDRPTQSARARSAAHLRVTGAPRAGADLRLLQKTMGHASITVTAHVYADLYDDELDDIASALDALDDVRGDLP